MPKSVLLRYFLFAAFVCLCAITVGAQEPEPQPPPSPSTVAPTPPDPSPPTPPLDWEPLPPSPPAEEPNPAPLPAALFVPPPSQEVSVPMPPAAPVAVRSGPPSAVEIERITPQVEIWRGGANAPQRPARHGSRLAQAFVTGNDAVVVWLQFDPLARGKAVIVTPGRGITLEQPESVFRIQSTGDCFVTVKLDEGVARGHLDFYCEGLSTTLSLSRATPSAVAAKENMNAGSGR